MHKAIMIIGSILLIIALGIPLSWLANYCFNQKVKKQINEFFSNVTLKKDIIKRADLEGLPPNVQNGILTENIAWKAGLFPWGITENLTG